MVLPAVVQLDREDEWNIDHILNEIGGFGKFQKRVYITSILNDIFVAMCILFFIFADYNPGWRCDDLSSGNDTVITTTLGTKFATSWGNGTDIITTFRSTFLPTTGFLSTTKAANVTRKKRSMWQYFTNQEPSAVKMKSKKKRSLFSLATTQDPVETGPDRTTQPPGPNSENGNQNPANVTQSSVNVTQGSLDATNDSVSATTPTSYDTTTEEVSNITTMPTTMYAKKSKPPVKVSGWCAKNGTKCPAYTFVSPIKTTTTEVS
jgi:hypothetical protein